MESDRIGNLSRQLQDLGPAPKVAVVAGSGWKDRAETVIAENLRIPLENLEGWPAPAVEGHGGELVLGALTGPGGGRKVALLTGRVHGYEGHPARVLVRGIRALARWGVRGVILTNAAGSLHLSRPAGSLMIFEDHINFGLPSPQVKSETETEEIQFLDLSDLWNASWRAALRTALPDLESGIYAGLLGPTYETPAEVRHLLGVGVDAVGMSTIPEGIAAHACGMKVLGLSMLTNLAAGIDDSRPSHAEVLATAAAHADHAAAVLSAAIRVAPID